MVIIELTYIRPIEDVEKHLEAHRAFLDTYYAQKVFIASGPKIPREGGIILALTDKSGALEIIEHDPFHQPKIADYRIIEFNPSRHSQDFAIFT